MFLSFEDFILEVLVALELSLNVFDVFLELDLPVVCLLELLPELVELASQTGPLPFQLLYLLGQGVQLTLLLH